MIDIPEKYFVDEVCTCETHIPGEIVACNVLSTLKNSKPCHTVDYYNAFLVVAGKGTYTDWQGHTTTLEPGCFVQNLPGKCFTVVRHTHPWLQMGIRLPASWYRVWTEMGIVKDQAGVFESNMTLDELHQFWELHNQLSSLAAGSLASWLLGLQEWLLNIHGHDASDAELQSDPRIEQAKQLLHQNCCQNISPKDIAKRVGMSYSHFRRLFKQQVGISPADYTQKYRLDQAKYLLQEPSISLKHIADLCGFSNPYSFSATFKKCCGVSPSQYRSFC